MNRGLRRSLLVLALVALVALVAGSACSGGDGSAVTTTTEAVAETDPLDDVFDDIDELDDELGADDAGSGFSDLPVLDDVVATPWEPATRTEQLLTEIDADGPTLQHAIDIYDLTFAEMPGATPSELPEGTGFSTSYAQVLIDSFRDQLAPEQRAVVEEFDASVVASGTIDLTTGEIGAPSAGPAAGRGGFGRSSSPRRAQADYARLAPLLTRAHNDFRKHRPDLPFPKTVVFEISAIQPVRGDDMNTSPFPGDAAVCQIQAFPRILSSNSDDATYLVTFLHELMHCVQFQLVPEVTSFPPWLYDGSANFAAFDVYQRVPTRYSYQQWWTNPQDPLANRQYDAWVLFASYQQAGGDAYAAVVNAFKGATRTTTGVLQASGLSQPAFVPVWSSKSLRSTRYPESAWQTSWPGSAGTGPRDNLTPKGSRGIGTFTVVGSGLWSHQQLLVGMDEEVGLLTVVPQEGTLTTHTANGSVRLPVFSSRLLCFDNQRCPCPDGSTVGTPMDGREMIFSLSADEKQSSVQAAGERWDEAAKKKYCQKKKEKKKRSTHNGDPHLVTFDGLPLDVMALGEFVVARDPEGGFEVQARHEPYPLRGTGTSAVAVGGGGQRITFTADDLADEAILTVRVDGQEVTDRPASVTLGDATATPLGEVEDLVDAREHWRVEWPDGSAVEVYWRNGWFVAVEAATDRAGRLVGLLGSSNEDFVDDLLLPDGSALPLGPPTQIDEVFAPAWQVDAATTLFDYVDGETPSTFVGPPPPPPDPPSEEVVEQCTAALGEGASQHEVGFCTYDVMATGDESFVDAYAHEIDARLEADPNPFLDPFPAEAEVKPTDNGTEPIAGTAGVVALTLEGSLYDGFTNNSDASSVGRLVGSLDVAAGAIVVARAPVCLPDVTLIAELTSRDSAGTTQIYVCDPAGYNQLGARDGDEVVTGEAYAWIPAGGVYDVKITTDSLTPFVASVELYTDGDPTILDLDTVSDGGATVTLSGTGDTVVLPFDLVDFLSLESSGLDGACNLYLYGADPMGDPASAPWNARYCGHAEQLSMSPTFGEIVPFVVFLRIDDPVEVSLGPAI